MKRYSVWIVKDARTGTLRNGCADKLCLERYDTRYFKDKEMAIEYCKHLAANSRYMLTDLAVVDVTFNIMEDFTNATHSDE